MNLYVMNSDGSGQLNLTPGANDGQGNTGVEPIFTLSREMSEKLKLSFGSYYSLYKYDLFLVSERDDVRTYYLRLRWKGGPAWTL